MNGLDPLKSVWFNMPHNLSLLRNVPTSMGMSLEPRKAYLFFKEVYTINHKREAQTNPKTLNPEPLNPKTPIRTIRRPQVPGHGACQNAEEAEKPEGGARPRLGPRHLCFRALGLGFKFEGFGVWGFRVFGV